MSHQHASAGRIDILARNSKRNYRPPLRPVPTTVHVRPLREPVTVLTPLRHTGASEQSKVVPGLTQRRRGSRGLSPRILNLGTRWARMVSFMLRPPYPCKIVVGVRKAVWSPQTSWSFRTTAKLLALAIN
jgi:hypothetical protein